MNGCSPQAAARWPPWIWSGAAHYEVKFEGPEGIVVDFGGYG